MSDNKAQNTKVNSCKLFTSQCHSDVSACSGKFIGVQFPVVVGHEASGIVESVGDGVENFKTGDHVITLFLPQVFKSFPYRILKYLPYLPNNCVHSATNAAYAKKEIPMLVWNLWVLKSEA